MKRWINNIFSGCFIVLTMFLASCSDQDEEDTPTTPKSFVISELIYQHQIIITESPTFDFSGSLKFTGAKKGVKELHISSSLGADLVVPVHGVSVEQGEIIGTFTFTMVSEPGTFTFTVWMVDGADRKSNELSGSFEMIRNPYKPPTAVVLQSVAWDDATHSALLNWSENNDDNFYAYIVKRHRGSTSILVATILDQHVTSVHDEENHGTIGFQYSYTVEVSNNTLVTASNELSWMHPQASKLSFILGAIPPQRPALSSTRAEMYLVTGNVSPVLNAVSTTSHAVLRTFNLLPTEYGNVFALSKDDSKLYIVARDSLIILNASTFEVIKSAHLHFFGRAIVSGRSDRLYAAAYAPAAANGLIKILDANTGREVGETGLKVPMALLDISADNNTLYVVSRPAYVLDPSVLWKVDISTDVPEVIEEKELPGYVSRMQRSDDEQSLFVTLTINGSIQSKISRIDTGTLEVISSYALTRATHALEFWATNNFIFIAGNSGDLDYAEVEQVDLVDHSVINFWECVYPGPTFLQVTNDNKGLYLFFADHSFLTDQSWIVPLE